MHSYQSVRVLVSACKCTRISLYVYSYGSDMHSYQFVTVLVSVCTCTHFDLYMHFTAEKKNTHVTLVLYNFVRIPIYVSSFNIQNVYYAIGL